MNDELLRKISVEKIEEEYRNKYITAKRYNQLIRDKARLQLKDTMAEEGFFGSILSRTLKHAQEGWDNLKTAATREDKPGLSDDAKAVGQAVWGQIQILTSVFTAVGEVSGQKAEDVALKYGASPGLARAINLAVDVGTGLIPVAGASKLAVKGGQKLLGAVVKKGAKEAAEAVAKSAVDDVSETIIKKGLELDGVVVSAKEPASVSAEVIKRGKEFLANGKGKLPETPAGVDESAEVVAEVLKRGKEFLKVQGKADLDDAFARYADEIKRITTRKPHEITLREAEKLGLNVDDLKNLAAEKGLNEVEMAAYLKALDEPLNNLFKLAEQTVAGVDGAADAFARQMVEFLEYAPKFRQAEVTAGRAVEILKENPPMKALTDLLASWDPRSIAKGNLNDAIATMAEDVVSAGKDAKRALKALAVGNQQHGFFKDGLGAQIREVYINLLLSRPLTHIRNFLGNGYAAMTSAVERGLGDIVASDKKLVDRFVYNEGVAQFKGMMAALGDGIKAFADAFKKDPDASKLDFERKIPGLLGRIINVPGTVLGGMDEFFKTILRRGDYYAQALRAGYEKGLRGDELAKFVSTRVAIPTREMQRHADDFAKMHTFQSGLGEMGQGIQKFLQAGPLALLFPFMKTPMNIAKYAWNRAPGLQFISKQMMDDLLAGGARAEMAVGRVTLANMMGMYIYGLAQEGLLTGGGPADPRLRRTWLLTHQPYSIKVGDKWVQIANIDPGSTIFGIIADFAQVANQLDEMSAGQMATAISLALTRDIVDKSYWQGMNDLTEAFMAFRVGEGMSDKLQTFATRPLFTFATGGPVGAAVARAVDPVRRDVRGLLDQYISRVPGYSKTLPPLRDALGDPVLPPQALRPDWVPRYVAEISGSAFGTKDVEKEDKLRKAVSELGIRVPGFPTSIGGKDDDDWSVQERLPGDPVPVELSPEERDRWQVLYRNVIRHPEYGIEATILNSDEYVQAPFALKRAMVTNALMAARRQARDTLLVENPALAKKVIEATAGKFMPMATPEERPDMETSVEDAIDYFARLAPQAVEELGAEGFLGSGEDRDQMVITQGTD